MLTQCLIQRQFFAAALQWVSKLTSQSLRSDRSEKVCSTFKRLWSEIGTQNRSNRGIVEFFFYLPPSCINTAADGSSDRHQLPFLFTFFKWLFHFVFILLCFVQNADLWTGCGLPKGRPTETGPKNQIQRFGPVSVFPSASPTNLPSPCQTKPP